MRILEIAHRYVPIVVIVIRSFAHSWLITSSVTTVTRQAPHVEQGVLNIPEYVYSPPVYFGSASVAQSLVFCVEIFISLFVRLPFFFLAIILYARLWLSLWYLHIFRVSDGTGLTMHRRVAPNEWPTSQQ